MLDDPQATALLWGALMSLLSGAVMIYEYFRR